MTTDHTALKEEDYERIRWNEFVEAVSRCGHEDFVASGINHAELGLLVREMDGTKVLTDTNKFLNELRNNLVDRFHSGAHTGPAIADAFERQQSALHAAFAYSLNLRSGTMREWCRAALHLHLERKKLFSFMLGAKFGIELDEESEMYIASYAAFQAWTNTFADVLAPKK